jgi:hypothetical protein
MSRASHALDDPSSSGASRRSAAAQNALQGSPADAAYVARKPAESACRAAALQPLLPIAAGHWTHADGQEQHIGNGFGNAIGQAPPAVSIAIHQACSPLAQ